MRRQLVIWWAATKLERFLLIIGPPTFWDRQLARLCRDKVEQTAQVEISPSATIQGVVDMANTCPKLRQAVIIRLLQEDDISRCLLAEALGEQALREAADDAAQARYYERKRAGGQPSLNSAGDAANHYERKRAGDAANHYERKRAGYPPSSRSWDEIMLEVLARMANTPGGRGEV